MHLFSEEEEMGLPLVIAGMVGLKIVTAYVRSSEREVGRRNVGEVLREYGVPEDLAGSIVERIESKKQKGVIDDIRDIIAPYLTEIREDFAEDLGDVRSDFGELLNDAQEKLGGFFITLGSLIKGDESKDPLSKGKKEADPEPMKEEFSDSPDGLSNPYEELLEELTGSIRKSEKGELNPASNNIRDLFTLAGEIFNDINEATKKAADDRMKKE